MNYVERSKLCWSSDYRELLLNSQTNAILPSSDHGRWWWSCHAMVAKKTRYTCRFYTKKLRGRWGVKERRAEGRQEHIIVDEEQRVRETERGGAAETHSQCAAVNNVPEKKYYGCYNSRTLHSWSTYSLRRCLVSTSAAVWIGCLALLLNWQIANCKQPDKN